MLDKTEATLLARLSGSKLTPRLLADNGDEVQRAPYCNRILIGCAPFLADNIQLMIQNHTHHSHTGQLIERNPEKAKKRAGKELDVTSIEIL